MKRWVVKAGSNMVCAGGPLLLRSWSQQIARLRREHRVEVVWVTSGAIASAVERTDAPVRKDRSLAEKQALSAVGQPIVMDQYNLALSATGLLGAQVLLTYDDLANARRRKNFVNTINQLLKWKAVPILNENDAVATEEIKFGDNDSLSARVAKAVGADRLIILTDVEGYFTGDPRRDASAKLVHELAGVTPQALKAAGGAGSKRGTGGMFSKLSAAREAIGSGIETWLAKGDRHDVLLRIAREDRVGTRVRTGRRR